MRKLSSVLFAFMFFLSIKPAMANEIPSCPAIADIKKIGLLIAEERNPNSYVAYSLDKYNTSMMWGFMIGMIPAESTEQALGFANKIVQLMTESGVRVDTEGDFYCEYNTNIAKIKAIAMMEQEFSLNKTRKLF